MNLGDVFISLPDFTSQTPPSTFQTIIVTFKIASEAKYLAKHKQCFRLKLRNFSRAEK